MNLNEPVAWMHHCLKSGIGYLSYTKPPPLDDYKPIPLYTHLVKEQDCYGDGNVYRGVRSKDSEVQTIYFNPVKELTDGEIVKIFQTADFWQRSDLVHENDAIDFARAIEKRIMRNERK